MQFLDRIWHFEHCDLGNFTSLGVDLGCYRRHPFIRALVKHAQAFNLQLFSPDSLCGLPPITDDPINGARRGRLQSSRVSDVVNPLKHPIIRVDMSLGVIGPSTDECNVITKLAQGGHRGCHGGYGCVCSFIKDIDS